MIAENESDLPILIPTRICLRVHHAKTIGLEDVRLGGVIALEEFVVILSGGNADGCNRRVVQHQFFNGGAEIGDGIGIGLIGGDAVLSRCTVGKYVPVKQGDLNATVTGMLEDLLPMRDLLLDRHPLHQLERVVIGVDDCRPGLNPGSLLPIRCHWGRKS